MANEDDQASGDDTDQDEGHREEDAKYRRSPQRPKENAHRPQQDFHLRQVRKRRIELPEDCAQE